MKPIKGKTYNIIFMEKNVPDYSWFRGKALCTNDVADKFLTEDDNGTPNYEFSTLKEDGSVKLTECFFPEWAIGCDIEQEVSKRVDSKLNERIDAYLDNKLPPDNWQEERIELIDTIRDSLYEMKQCQANFRRSGWEASKLDQVIDRAQQVLDKV